MNNTAVLVMGTFNPITNAHIQMGVKAKELIPEATIFYIPSSLSFMKDWKTIKEDNVFNDTVRIKLLTEVLSSYGFSLSLIEANGMVDGRTYNTVSFVKEVMGFKNVYVCIGSDKLSEISKWYNIEHLLCENRLLVFIRNESEISQLEYFLLAQYIANKKIKTVNSLCDCGISSTKVRNAFYDNKLETIKDEVPEQVYDYLIKRRNDYV